MISKSHWSYLNLICEKSQIALVSLLYSKSTAGQLGVRLLFVTYSLCAFVSDRQVHLPCNPQDVLYTYS